MDMQFLEETKMLNYQSVGIQKLINEKRWGELSEYEKIKAIYGFVQNERPLGVFPNPDKFFEHYTQHWCKMKDFMYVHFGRKIMNYNVGKMRKSRIKSMDTLSCLRK